MKYKGWIGTNGHREDRKVLQDIGIQLGPYDPERKEFSDCIVSEEAMELLDDYWGAFYWGLQHVLGKVIFTPYSGNLPKADYYLMAVRYMKEKEDRIRHYFHEPSLAPSQELFNMVQNLRDTNQWTKQNFEEFFRPSFLDQVWQEPMASSINDLVRMINDGHTVCVMCYCRDLSKCHLSILAEVFVDTLGCSGQVELHYNGLVINSRLSERLKEMKKGLK